MGEDLSNINYKNFREGFISQLERIKQSEVELIHEQIQHPLRDRENQKIFLDVVYIGKLSATKALVLIAGTSGVEGYSGSMNMQYAMEKGVAGFVDEDTAVILIHALNPYGMAYYRRCDEHGIDVNRNCLLDFNTLPENHLFERVKEFMIPRNWNERSVAETTAKIHEIVENSYYSKFEEHFRKGQYKYWNMPYYGGESASWSCVQLKKIVEKYMKNKHMIGILDFHVGLGEMGDNHLVGVGDKNSLNSRAFIECFGEKANLASYEFPLVPYRPIGTAIEMIMKLLPTTVVVAACDEYGTRDRGSVLIAMRADCWLHSQSDMNEERYATIKKQIVSNFYSSDLKWQKVVKEQALENVDTLGKFIRNF